MSVYPVVGDLLEYNCSYDNRKYIGILKESFYMSRNFLPSFRVLWGDKDEPKSYHKYVGFHLVNMLNESDEFKFYRDGKLLALIEV